MMGELPKDQGTLFYDFCLEDHVPKDHLLRRSGYKKERDVGGEMRNLGIGQCGVVNGPSEHDLQDKSHRFRISPPTSRSFL